MPTVIRRYTELTTKPPNQGGLQPLTEARTERFGMVYYGETPARDAAGIWGERLPLARIDVKLERLCLASLHNTPVPLGVVGMAGWMFARPHKRLPDRLLHSWSRDDRAVHVELPDRRYTYRLRGFSGAQVTRHWHGVVVRERHLSWRVADSADDIDAAVALLLSRAVGRDSMVLLAGWGLGLGP